MRLSRTEKAVRNLLITALLLLLRWMVLGYPALTPWGELRRGEQAALVEGFSLVTQDRSYYGVKQTFGRRDNQFLYVSTYDPKIWSGQIFAKVFDTAEGVLCVQRHMQEEFLVLGDVNDETDATLLLENHVSGATMRGALERRMGKDVLMFSVPGVMEDYDWTPQTWSATLTLYDEVGKVLREISC